VAFQHFHSPGLRRLPPRSALTRTLGITPKSVTAMPFEKPASDLTFVKLFVVVLLGVAGGNLLSNWITARVVAHQLEVGAAEATARAKVTLEQAQKAAASAQAQAQKETAARTAQAEQSRREDKIGRKLAQICAEWTKANQELQSYTTRTEQEKACTRLSNYVSSGVPPRD
jgi:hypothetical protein